MGRVGWGQAKEPASQRASFQNYLLANYPFVLFPRAKQMVHGRFFCFLPQKHDEKNNLKTEGLGRIFLNIKNPNARILEGILQWYPEIGDRPKKVLSNPPEGSIEPLKRFYRTLIGSIEPPFGPQKGCIEPFFRTTARRLSNLSHGPPPFLGYPFKILPRYHADF